MYLHTVLSGILCCWLSIVTGQSSDAEIQTSDFTQFGSFAEMEMMRSLFGLEPCYGENCGESDVSSSLSDNKAENIEIPQHEYPSATADEYPESSQPEYPSATADEYPESLQPEYPSATADYYPESSQSEYLETAEATPTNEHTNDEHIEKVYLCEELVRVVKEIEAKHPEFAISKYELLKKLKSYSELFSSELAKGSSEDVLTKILNLFILIADKVKADFKAETSEKGKYLEPEIPIVEDVSTEEIIAEEEDIEHPYPAFVGSVRGIPGFDYPNYSEVPITSFSCADKKYIPGFYADMETGCQVFHVCYEHRRESFLCPIGTVFNQPILACDYWYSSNCSLSQLYYDVNIHNKELSKQADEVESTIGALITTIIDGEKPEMPNVHVKDSKFDKQDLGDLVKFMPVKATVVEFPEFAVPKVEVQKEIPDPKQVDEVASKIVDELVTTTSHLASKTEKLLKAIPEPSYKITEKYVSKPFLVGPKAIENAASIPVKVKVATKAKKIAAAKLAAPVIAKSKLATAAKIAIPIKAKIASSVPLVKAAAAKVSIPVAAKVKLAAAAPIAKVAAAKFAVPVAATLKAAAAKASVPVAITAAKAASVPIAKAAAAKVVVPVAVKAKKAAAVPIAKAAAAKVAVPVAVKAKKAAAVPIVKAAAAKVAVPVAVKAKKAAAVPIAKAAKFTAPVAAKVKKSVSASLPFAKTKFKKAAAVPVKGKMFALPVAKKFAAAGLPVIKAKKLPLVLAGAKPVAPLVKAKLAKAVAISPLTKKALALGYMKLLKAKKLAVIG